MGQKPATRSTKTYVSFGVGATLAPDSGRRQSCRILWIRACLLSKSPA